MYVEFLKQPRERELEIERERERRTSIDPTCSTPEKEKYDVEETVERSFKREREVENLVDFLRVKMSPFPTSNQQNAIERARVSE